MNRLSGNFIQLRDDLISWRRMGHGLWPIRYWPDGQECVAFRPRHSFVLIVQNGRDLILLIRMVLGEFNRISPTDKDQLAEDHPMILLETILFALIAMVYPEEPGDLTNEELFMNF